MRKPKKKRAASAPDIEAARDLNARYGALPLPEERPAAHPKFGPRPSPAARASPPAPASRNGAQRPGRGRVASRAGSGEVPIAERPSLPDLDELEVLRSDVQAFRAGNRKLTMAVDELRKGLETIITMEWDYELKRPVDAEQMRAVAEEALQAYSRISRQNWRLPRNRVVESRAGDRDISDAAQRED